MSETFPVEGMHRLFINSKCFWTDIFWHCAQKNPSDITYDAEVLLGPWHNAAEQLKQMQEQDATEHLQVPAACVYHNSDVPLWIWTLSFLKYNDFPDISETLGSFHSNQFYYLAELSKVK